ncbi:MAG TPA: aminotransferase class V-fold PLP-dependent enzyme [Spirochaetota bacterium]|nr:aminotransferase class V-fold PLP-dependent enzyme [Spirochaetota bacterium]
MTIYFDNAATSWPKPDSVIEAMIHFNENIGSNPGRSGHSRSVEAGQVLFSAREAAARLFGIKDPLRIILTANVTHSLNIVIRGLLKEGDHVITSSMEHNSVMRPLRYMETLGVEITTVKCNQYGETDPQDVKNAIKSNTKLIIMNHASNVTGTILPIKDIGAIAKEHGIIFCIDAAQSAGVLDIDVEKMNIDILCFTGHKGLMGPMGTGGFYLNKGLESQISPLYCGGTGSFSEFETQPDFVPDKYEAGTLNAIGFAGLAAGINFLLETGVAEIKHKESKLTQYFLENLKAVSGVKIYNSPDLSKMTSVVSFNIDGVEPSEGAFIFDDHYSICSRAGLHCAPIAHRSIGTFPVGTIRFSFGYFNSFEEIDIAINALRDMVKKI